MPLNETVKWEWTRSINGKNKFVYVRSSMVKYKERKRKYNSTPGCLILRMTLCACHFHVEINFMICEIMPELHCSVYVIHT